MLNYGCVALALVTTGGGGDAGGGGTAQLVSNASFAALSLIYSCTEVLDAADAVSTLAGLTTRVAQLREVLPSAWLKRHDQVQSVPLHPVPQICCTSGLSGCPSACSVCQSVFPPIGIHCTRCACRG
jgi:hypothetical protein